MIAATILVTALLEPAGNTTWWRTDGAAVIQQSDRDVCALYVFQQRDAVSFLWDKAALSDIVFFKNDWNFAPASTKVEIRIGTNWISGDADRQELQATEADNALLVHIHRYPVESLLRSAGSVSLRHSGGELNIPLDKTKMAKLLQATETCREHLR